MAEIEVTAEMVEAGVYVLLEHGEEPADFDDVVRDVFEAMLRRASKAKKPYRMGRDPFLTLHTVDGNTIDLPLWGHVTVDEHGVVKIDLVTTLADLASATSEG